jgi:hypothetical protein
MAATRIAILLAVLSVATAAQEVPSDSNVPPGNQPERGTVCVLPNSSEPPTRTSPGGEYNPATLSVKIEQTAADSLAAQKTSQDRAPKSERTPAGCAHVRWQTNPVLLVSIF